MTTNAYTFLSLSQTPREICPCLSQDLAGVADVHGNSPLHVASAHGYRRVVDFLLQQTDAAVDQGNHVGLTPLHRACAGKHVKVVRTLIANGADPHKRDSDGHTALHHSAAVGDAATITFLCKHCDVVIEPESSDGSTPIDLALQAGFKETAGLIAKHLAVSMRADRLRSSLKLFSPYFEKKQSQQQLARTDNN
jgi:ankyrin repeat protein